MLLTHQYDYLKKLDDDYNLPLEKILSFMAQEEQLLDRNDLHRLGKAYLTVSEMVELDRKGLDYAEQTMKKEVEFVLQFVQDPTLTPFTTNALKLMKGGNNEDAMALLGGAINHLKMDNQNVAQFKPFGWTAQEFEDKMVDFSRFLDNHIAKHAEQNQILIDKHPVSKVEGVKQVAFDEVSKAFYLYSNRIDHREEQRNLGSNIEGYVVGLLNQDSPLVKALGEEKLSQKAMAFLPASAVAKRGIATLEDAKGFVAETFTWEKVNFSNEKFNDSMSVDFEANVPTLVVDMNSERKGAFANTYTQKMSFRDSLWINTMASLVKQYGDSPKFDNLTVTLPRNSLRQEVQLNTGDFTGEFRTEDPTIVKVAGLVVLPSGFEEKTEEEFGVRWDGDKGFGSLNGYLKNANMNNLTSLVPTKPIDLSAEEVALAGELDNQLAQKTKAPKRKM